MLTRQNANKLENIDHKIVTRSLKKLHEKYENYNLKPIYDVNIDFDGASREWNKNKIKLSDGCYEYKKMSTPNTPKTRSGREYNRFNE